MIHYIIEKGSFVAETPNTVENGFNKKACNSRNFKRRKPSKEKYSRDINSQKRPAGRNLGGNRLVRRSGTTSRGTVLLVFCLRMRRFPLTLVLTIFVGMKWIAPVTVEADFLSSLIVFYNWFWERATAEADFVGSCRTYILSLISYVSCWRSTDIFLCFSLSISTLIVWAIDCWSRCFRLV